MDIVVLHNRTAGDEEPSPGRLLALLRREGYHPHYFDLHTALEDGAQLPAADFIVVAGGDGSFRQAALQLRSIGRPFALLPVGTANNIARSLGIEGTPAEVIASWDAAKPARYDIGVVRGPWGERRFVEGVGVGLFGRIISILQNVEEPDAHATAARPHRVASDLRSTTVLAHEMAPVPLAATVDHDKLSGDFLLLEVLNISRVGAGIELTAEADPSDGFLEVVTAELAERSKLLASLRNVARSAPVPSQLSRRRCRRAVLELPACELRVDDEVIPLGEPATIEIALAEDAAVEVLLPES